VRRVVVVLLLVAIVLLAAGLFVALRGGSTGDDAVAHVGGRPITKSQLEAVVAHFRTEAQQEGKPFPAESTDAGKRTRNRLLGLLVYRVELRQAARRRGITVAPLQVLKRLQVSAGSEEANRDSFAYGSAETQLLFEAIFSKVTSNVKAPNRTELAARRNAAMTGFVTRLQREATVRYEPGYAPGS
jgi:hypothetical protein